MVSAFEGVMVCSGKQICIPAIPAKSRNYYNEKIYKAIGLPWQLSWLRIHLQCRRSRFDSWVRKICWIRDRLSTPAFSGFPCGSTGKESACIVGDLGSIPGLGRYPGEGHGYPLQLFWLQSQMRLSLSFEVLNPEGNILTGKVSCSLSQASLIGNI